MTLLLRVTPAPPLALRPERLVPPWRPEPEHPVLLEWPPLQRPAPSPPGRLDANVRDQASALIAAVVEVLRGRRPVQHLATHTTAQTARLLAGHPPDRDLGLASIRLTQPSPGTIEAAIRLQRRGLSRAAALRLEQTGQSWRLTALELGLSPGVARVTAQ